MRGIRLYPNYHGYSLKDAVVERLFELSTSLKLIVGIVVQMEDERMMHPLLRVKPVDLEPLTALVEKYTTTKVLVLNAGRALVADRLRKLTGAGQVYVDISVFDGMGVMEQVVRDIALDRILFGSHSPLFYFESALLKLQESALPGASLSAIRHDNARRLVS